MQGRLRWVFGMVVPRSGEEDCIPKRRQCTNTEGHPKRGALPRGEIDRGLERSDDLRCFGHAFLHGSYGAARVFRVALEAPETQRLGGKEGENKPGQLGVLYEGNEGLTLDGVEGVNVHLL